jgi:hypothetical protein
LQDLIETETLSNFLLFSADPGAGPKMSEMVPTAHPQTIRDVRRPALEKFQLQNREKRKPSYRARVMNPSPIIRFKSHARCMLSVRHTLITG